MNNTTTIPNVTSSGLHLTTVKFPFGDKPYPPLVKKIGFSILPIIIFFSVLGNSLVIHLTRKHAILKGNMKALIINLAVCNIALCIFPFLYLIELGTNEWHFASIGCDILVVLEYAVLTSANLSLVHIAFERLCAIVKPFKRRIGKKSTICMLVISWLAGFPLAIPFVVLQPRYVDDDHPNAAAQPECNNMWAVTTTGMKTPSLVYYSVMFVLLYAVPAALMCIIYGKVIYVLLRKIKRPGHQTEESKQLEHKKKLRTIKLLWSTVIIFKLFWLPSYIQEFLLAGGVQDLKNNVRIQVINLICAAFGYTYCVVTPFLYFIFNQQYKNALRESMRSVQLFLKSPFSARNSHPISSSVTLKNNGQHGSNGDVDSVMSTPIVQMKRLKSSRNDAFQQDEGST